MSVQNFIASASFDQTISAKADENAQQSASLPEAVGEAQLSTSIYFRYYIIISLIKAHFTHQYKILLHRLSLTNC